MDKILDELKTRFPALQFKASATFSWSPETSEIMYKQAADQDDEAIWALLHETGHALLQHASYTADYELVRLEVAAWEQAKIVAAELNLEIDENHIQDCLDTYRDWLDKRSICPTCLTKSIQQDNYRHYQCFNCHTVWRVSASRFCRAYRSTKNVPHSPAVFI
jgi:NADH pyrophosphatase NudC (nudix superfamily)